MRKLLLAALSGFVLRWLGKRLGRHSHRGLRTRRY